MGTRDETLTLASSSITRLARGVTAWEPEIVLAPGSAIALGRPLVAVGEPVFRPDAVSVQLDATRTLLLALSTAQAVLTSETAAAQMRLTAAGSDRARVTAAQQAYRAESELDRVLIRARDEVIDLMTQRGLR
jgi:hypothetical protein